MDKDKDYTFHSENGSVWVNGKHNCLGRFTTNGWEIFRSANSPTEVIGPTGTLAVRMHPTKPMDWSNFVKLMEQHHKIDLSNEESPFGKA